MDGHQNFLERDKNAIALFICASCLDKTDKGAQGVKRLDDFLHSLPNLSLGEMEYPSMCKDPFLTLQFGKYMIKRTIWMHRC